MDKHISAFYIKEKMYPVEQLVKIVNETLEGDSDTANIAEKFSESQRREVAFAFAVIAKELGVKIPDV